jgi:hypothetical protein
VPPFLMHDFQKHTAEALPTLLARLKAGGLKVDSTRTNGKTSKNSLEQRN